MTAAEKFIRAEQSRRSRVTSDVTLERRPMPRTPKGRIADWAPVAKAWRVVKILERPQSLADKRGLYPRQSGATPEVGSRIIDGRDATGGAGSTAGSTPATVDDLSVGAARFPPFDVSNFEAGPTWHLDRDTFEWKLGEPPSRLLNASG